MSSIEKAMDKLAGRTPAASPSAEPSDSSAKAADPSAERPPTTEPPGDEGRTPVEPPVETRVPDPAAPSGTPDERTVWIDFDRLAAKGNLTPGTQLIRESEEYQYIKRRLLGNVALNAGTAGRPANLIMVTSSVPGEGKTFTTINLSMSITFELDHTVLVVDTDIMKRDLSRELNLEDRPGLYDYLDGQIADISEVIYRTNVPHLAIIPSGRYKAASTELLASARMLELVNEFATRYRDRVVLFDTPPLLATSTAVALAPKVGQVVLVVEAGATRRNTVQQALDVLDRLPVTGMILNKAKGNRLKPYDYYGNYYAQPVSPASS